jgi:Na+/H+ antiporter NhaD/arsenite permease-like protein
MPEQFYNNWTIWLFLYGLYSYHDGVTNSDYTESMADEWSMINSDGWEGVMAGSGQSTFI